MKRLYREFMNAYSGQIFSFFSFGGRPTPQLLELYVKSSLDERWISIKYKVDEVCSDGTDYITRNKTKVQWVSTVTRKIQSDLSWNTHSWSSQIIFMGLKTSYSNGTRLMVYLLNQSPELYESRSSDFERRISSPEWKNGIPCAQKLFGYW